MAKARIRIGLREIRALAPGQMLNDTLVQGFAARRQGDRITFVLRYRSNGKQRWHTIGAFGAGWVPDNARAEAKKLLGEIIQGGDPSGARLATRRSMTITELCDAYWAELLAGRVPLRDGRPKRPDISNRGWIQRHIKPLLGRLRISAVTGEQVRQMMFDVADGKTTTRTRTAVVRGGPGAARNCVAPLGVMYGWASERGLYDGANPVRGVRVFQSKRRDRRFSDDEYAKLGVALAEATRLPAMWPTALPCLLFLMVTGWRLSEATLLRRSAINFATRTVVLNSTKTGQSIRPLSRIAAAIVHATPWLDDELVFPAPKQATPNGGTTSLRRVWLRVRKLAGLANNDDLLVHTMRHSFASVASDLQFAVPTIAQCIGHVVPGMTGSYIHRCDAVLLAAADTVAESIIERLGGRVLLAPLLGDAETH